MKAEYKSEYEINLPIKLKEEIILRLEPIGCLEFTLEHVEKNRFNGHLIVPMDTPDMLEATRKIKQVMDRILQIINIEHRVTKEFLEIHPPILINPQDWENIEKTAFADIPVKVSIAVEMDKAKFSKISDILTKIENYPSKPYMYRILKVFDGYRQSTHDEKLVEGWRVVDLFIGQSRIKGDEGKTTRKLVNEFVSDHFSQKDSTQIVNKYKVHIDNLNKISIVSRDGKDWSKELKQSLSINHPKKIMMNSLLCIYEVRNLKLHKEESHPAYQTALFLLEGFLRDFWNTRLRDNFKQK